MSPQKKDGSAASKDEAFPRDSLTGLTSRGHFLEILEEALQQDRDSGARVALYLRPDHFGEIDERLGPRLSDALLKQLAHVIAGALSPGDTVARFGGTVFTVLLERPAFSEIHELAEKLRARVSETIFEMGKRSTGLTLSAGGIELSRASGDVDAAVSELQSVTRELRMEGGNALKILRSREQTSDTESQDAGWEEKIRWALNNDALHLAYQPIASLKGAINNNFDVLVRMRDEQGEEILPGEFLPAAERTGLAPAIDRWVIRRAFIVAAARCAEGKETRIFIRVSEAALHDPNFIGWLSEETLSHQIDPGGIVLQVSDLTAERSLSRVRELAGVCSGLHFQLSLALSGAAANSGLLAETIPMDFLVLSSAYVNSLSQPGERVQLDRLITTASARGVPVIAARVENATVLASLYSLGVDYVTGYHVHAPEHFMVEDILLPSSSEILEAGYDTVEGNLAPEDVDLDEWEEVDESLSLKASWEQLEDD
jgi:diguanylate cyclase (GGDEF)-like protein